MEVVVSWQAVGYSASSGIFKGPSLGVRVVRFTINQTEVETLVSYCVLYTNSPL